jgi:hypothetical protein
MAMGKRRRHAKQASMWLATDDLPRSAAHPFYRRLNQIFDQDDFDGYVEGLCHAGGLNLGLLMRTLFGVGTPRGLQGRAAALFATLLWLLWHPVTACSLICGRNESQTTLIDLHKAPHVRGITVTVERAFATGH